MPGITEPFTCPHIPFISLSPISSIGATRISQVEVPINFLKKSSEGKPPKDSCHIALCPAEQRPLFKVKGFVFPVINAGIQSQCSTHENAFFRTFSSSRNTCKIFAQNHSEEYTP